MILDLPTQVDFRIQMNKETPVIETVNVSKNYKIGSNKIKALDNISITINEGEFASIVGKSGSGKSTLMHIIGLLDTPTLGSVYLRSNEVGNLSETELAKIRNKEIGFVFQSFNLLERATTLDNVILPLIYANISYKTRMQKAKEVLEIVGLKERMQNKSNELSGGQKQRVAIARALVNDPAIILADEPTGNLDTKTGEDIIELFRNLNKMGKTIIIVTHDEELAQVTERKIVISDGKII